MSQEIYTLYAVKINSTLIDQVREQRIDAGLRELIVSGDGAVDAKYAALMDIDPKMTFQTTDIAGFLGICGISGLAVTEVILYFQKTTESGIRAGAGAHKTVTVSAGLVLPRTISARQGGEAVLAFDVVLISSDGLTSPLTIASGQDLASGATVDAVFTLGPWKLNGSMQEGIQSLDVDFGLRERIYKHSGLPYPVRVHIEERKPRVRLRTTDVPFFTANDLDGVAQGATASLVWFRKLNREGVRVANATAEHIKFTIYDGIWKAGTVGGSHPSEQMADVEIEPISDGTNPILGVSAASAIS